MKIKRIIPIKNEEETRRFAHELAENLAPGDVLALIGDHIVYCGGTWNQTAGKQPDIYDCKGIYGRQNAAVSF